MHRGLVEVCIVRGRWAIAVALSARKWIDTQVDQLGTNAKAARQDVPRVPAPICAILRRRSSVIL